MLARIENKLEQMYNQIEFVDQNVILKIMTIRNKKKREDSRRKAQQDKDKALQDKKEQALQRAQRPSNKRNGRPLMMKSQPFKKNKKDDDKLKQILIKQLELDNLLYGNDLIC